ncbi:MAG: DUF3427 domain-containing protein [Pseudomonadota bacterium]
MADPAHSEASALPRLIRGGESDPLLPQLLASIRRAEEIELAVAFIKTTGLKLIYNALSERCEGERPARIRIITSDYLGVTDPQALRWLMLLAERGAEVRIYQTAQHSFHLKAYIFTREHGQRGEAFIGSSNISHEALTAGLEWNYRIEEPDPPGETRLAEIRAGFEAIFWATPETRWLDYDWIDAYELRRPDERPHIAPGSNDAELPPPTPTAPQQDALSALAESRGAGYSRGLVVLATGLGKTFLAAFDAAQLGAARVLFIAHREEILLQAEATFQRVFPQARVGGYRGTQQDTEAAMLFASVQTLYRSEHLEHFDPEAFDYIVVDEFHHAAAGSYRRLLNHFRPRFLLGLTATPERADRANILSLCDDNLVYEANLLHGIQNDLLCPFHYYGILDEAVDYQAIPWRDRRFDETALEHQLVTRARARHNLQEWRDKGGQRTLAFCASRSHADFMADQFQRAGVTALSVHGTSETTRDEAIEHLTAGTVQVVFSVDLFSEGVDIPAVDTVLLLRPTESPVLFLQQLGRGLRRAEGKDHLVILDFIGNHRAFLNRPQALLQTGNTGKKLREFVTQARNNTLELPSGCFANFDLRYIEFVETLIGGGPGQEFENLKAGLGRRPTAPEAFRAGLNMTKLRKEGGHWWGFLAVREELTEAEQGCVSAHGSFLREVETTRMEKSYKMILLEALLELDGFRHPPTLHALTATSAEVLRRRPNLLGDLPEALRDPRALDGDSLAADWRKNPIHFWTKENKGSEVTRWFTIKGERFQPTFQLGAKVSVETFASMVQELVDYRLARYQPNEAGDVPAGAGQVLPFPQPPDRTGVPYYPDLGIACGHFRNSRAEEVETIAVPPGHGRLEPERHFVARARGDSMNGGKHPIRDGDYLLLEWVTDTSAGSITGDTMAIERQDEAGDTQYLLRGITKTSAGHYILKAQNPDYEDLVADESMRTFARLKDVLDPLELARGQEFEREAIPALFGANFNPGSWNAGHVVLPDRTHILLVTLNKQGRKEDHRYLDYFIDERTFHWQSQNQTTPESQRGREIIEQAQRGTPIHLFVRDHKLGPDGRAAPFRYLGPVEYLSHEGSAPMGITFRLKD